jgi:phosphatidylserine decarboxylase
MVRDGYYYALTLLLAGLLIGWLASPLWGSPAWLLGAFCLWFFRDPERMVPEAPGAIVSPADGRVTDISKILVDGAERLRISIFLNIFNVHVNRSPIGGVIRDVRYQKGKFLNAMDARSAEENEQNIVTVEGQEHTVVFKQIAGLIARRIVFYKKVGDRVARGERVGLIKFGSRVDVLMEPTVQMAVKVGDHVQGASTILAYANARNELAAAGARTTSEGAR